jgi:hypothetical protein
MAFDTKFHFKNVRERKNKGIERLILCWRRDVAVYNQI